MSDLTQFHAAYIKGTLPKDEFVRKCNESHQLLWDYCLRLQDSDLTSIEITATTVIFKTKAGLIMTCAKNDVRTAMFEILNFGAYERPEMALMRRLVPADGIIFDIGANIGWYTTHLAKHVRDGAIFAFEPLPEAYGYLQRNIALNELKNVAAFNYGFSDVDGTVPFYYDPTHSGASSMRDLYADRPKECIRCIVKKMDDVSEKLTNRIDLIKCDVEGAEKLVVSGAVATIEKYTPVIVMELLRKWSAKYGYHPNEVVTTLTELGYQPFGIGENKVMRIDAIDDKTVETNFVFAHKQKHRAIIAQLGSHE